MLIELIDSTMLQKDRSELPDKGYLGVSVVNRDGHAEGFKDRYIKLKLS